MDPAADRPASDAEPAGATPAPAGVRGPAVRAGTGRVGPHVTAGPDGVCFTKLVRERCIRWYDVEEVWVPEGRGDPTVLLLTVQDELVRLPVPTGWYRSIRSQRRRAQAEAFASEVRAQRVADPRERAPRAVVTFLEQVEYRPGLRQHLPALPQLLWALALAAAGAALWARGSADERGLGAALAALAVVATALRLWVVRRTSLVLDGDGLAVRWGLRTRRLPWSEVGRAVVVVRWDGAAHVRFLDDERRPRSIGIERTIGAWPRERALQIAATVNDARAQVAGAAP